MVSHLLMTSTVKEQLAESQTCASIPHNIIEH